MTRLDPWDVQNPTAILAEALRRTRPRPGDVLVALLGRGDAQGQQLLDTVRVHRGDPPGQDEASETLRSHAQSLAGDRPWLDGRWAPPQGVLVTMVCRNGRVVPSAEELFWLMAWRYSNHMSNAFDGDVYLVTDHGWTGCRDARAGFSPSLRPERTPLCLVARSDHP